MLATRKEPTFGWNSNAGPNLRRKRLLDGEKVEVRSVEEGFLGSWFSGTVIESKKLRQRSIRYHEILSDDGTDFLVETVDVSEFVEGLISPDCVDVSGTLRGRLRPQPPKMEVDKWNLGYGLCVDVYTRDAWWEGVVYDHDNGSEKRRVLFPDLGDELTADIRFLRITQDWNECSEKWECRGRWLFLELIEKYMEDNYLPVSVEQLWYDIRDRIGFAKIRDWTCRTSRLWEDLMQEAIDENLIITINHLLHDYDSERCQQQKLKLLKEGSQVIDDTDASPDGVLVITPDKQQISCIDRDHKQAKQLCQSLSVLTSVSGIRSEECYNSKGIEFSSKRSPAAYKNMILPKNWQPFDCVAKPCPQAVSSYIRTQSMTVAMHVRKHLKYLGWTIEHMVDEGGRHRFNYITPDGKVEKSLRQICFLLKQRDESLTPPVRSKPLSLHYENRMYNAPPARGKPLSLSYENRMYNTQEMRRPLVLALPARNRKVTLGGGRKQSAETLLECEMEGKDEVTERENRSFYPGNAVPAQTKRLCVRLEPKPRAHGLTRLRSKRKRKPNLNYKSKKDEGILGLRNVNLSRRRGQTPRILRDIKNRAIGRSKTHASRSRRKVQRVITPITRNNCQRSILSWLIENNVILPREHIRFCNQKDNTVSKEGKLTRDGIKCSCCRRAFTISGFEVHAGGGSCRAAANIFLDDGRSLLQCQVEAYKTRKKAPSPDFLKIKLRQGENDIFCSVCQYGGDLILCDACPSAFHGNCLGLEDVPNGEWFCASCCCGACGEFILKDTSKYAKEEMLISCKQCEVKYHPSCLCYDGGGDSMDTFLREKGFCSKDCEEVFVNLHELIGKTRVVDTEKNLTWSLVQSLEPDTYGTEASTIETLAENHCKLSVALDLMHELFEPVKRPHAGGDLADRVIFSRWSKYKSLNFSGFYTILLERNGEFVTVATVRFFGKKVAEMPFIGTRFHHRQHGMCRVLMNELEKVLIDLGVERLVLPAVPCVLNTWTNSFGFTKMTLAERKDFLQFTFLEFGRTIMCQKILIKRNVADPIPNTVSLDEPHCDILRIEDNSASDDRSEVHQAEEHIVESTSTKNPSEGVKPQEESLRKENRILKCYTRRKPKRQRLT